MDWGVAHGDPLKFYSLSHEAKVAFLASNLVFGEEINKKKKKGKTSPLPSRLRDISQFLDE